MGEGSNIRYREFTTFVLLLGCLTLPAPQFTSGALPEYLSNPETGIVATAALLQMPSADCSSYDYCPASYDAARTQTCDAGNTALITDANGVQGGWLCVSQTDAWRRPFFDDDGIQLASGTPGNVWKRDFGHTASEPIDLGWYAWLAEGTRVDTLIDNIAADLGGDLFLRSPDVAGVDTLNWPSWIDLTGDITGDFRFEQSSKLVVYQKLTVSSTAYQDSLAFLTLDSGSNVYIGGPHPIKMEFRGHNNFSRPQHQPETQQTARPDLADALSFYGCGENAGTFNSLSVRVNVTQPLGGSIGVANSGCIDETDWVDVTYAGYVESAFRLNNGFDNAHLDSLVYSEPWGIVWGWNGMDYPDNNERSNSYKDGGVARMQSGARLTGKVVWMRSAKFFFTNMGQIGASQSDPFIMEFANNCYSGANTTNPDTQIDEDGFQQEVGKADGLGEGRYWWRLYRRQDDTLGQACTDGTFNLEATQDGSTCRVNRGFYMEVGDLTPGTSPKRFVIDTWQGGNGIEACDMSDRHTIVGLPGRPNLGAVRLVDEGTVHSGIFQDIVIDTTPLGQGSDNTVRDVTITGAIEIGTDTEGTTLENITFTGSPRLVVSISSGSDVTIPSFGQLAAPVGSMIDGSGILTCSGVVQTLPYTFDGQPDDCETTPGSASASVNPGWNMLTVPVRTQDMSPQALFPQSVSNAFSFSNVYDKAEVLSPGHAFWLKFDASAQIDFVGLVTEPSDVEIDSGWNMVGPLQTAVDVDQVTTTPADILDSDFFTYDGGYVTAQRLDVGVGYWVSASDAGVLHVTPSAGKTSRRTVATVTGTRLEFRDAAGSTGHLVLADGPIDARFKLPPPPPIGAFDVRFDTDTYIAEASRSEHVVRLSTLAYPVVVHVAELEDETIHLRDGVNGKIFNATLRDGDEAVIPRGITTLIVQTGTSHPAQWSLSGNYPNPVAATAAVFVSVPRDSQVTIDLYDVLGRRVQTVYDSRMQAGVQQVTIDATTLPSGLYFYRLRSDDFSAGRSMVVAR